MSICVSVLAESFISLHLPDTQWAPLVAGFGYTIGFVITIMGNLQLFTENTITVILPIATHPTVRNLGRLIRLWSAVLTANLTGTFIVALAMAHALIISDDQLAAALKVSAAHIDHDPLTILIRGIPAGFLVASIAWIVPNARGGEFWLIILITYVISIGGFSHVVAGSAEAWLLWLAGKTSLWDATVRYILPALVGNILGGNGPVRGAGPRPSPRRDQGRGRTPRLTPAAHIGVTYARHHTEPWRAPPGCSLLRERASPALIRRPILTSAAALATMFCLSAPINRAAAADADLIARGKYLTTAGDCIACHTIPWRQGFPPGNRAMETPFCTIYTPNITPDKATGIGNWTDDQF